MLSERADIARTGRIHKVRGHARPRRRRRVRRWSARLGALGTALFVVAGIALRFAAAVTIGPGAPRAAIAALPREEIPADGARPRVSYLRAGNPEGRRVILIHGTPGSATDWADVLVQPAPSLEYIAVDRPGFGESDPGAALPSFQAQADALAPLLVERRGVRPILVGHSLGGPIAARLAADRPDEVGGLVLVAGSFDPAFERPGFFQSVAASAPVRTLLPRALANSLVELNATLDDTTTLAPLLANIRCPVIIIHGTTDGLVVYENVSYVRERLTGAASVEVVTLEGQGHFIPWQRADVIRDAIRRLALLGAPEVAEPR